MSRVLAILGFAVFSAVVAMASVFGGVRILVHDPQHRALPGAEVTLHDSSSGVTLSAVSDGQGVALFQAIPIGTYQAKIDARGFSSRSLNVIVVSDRVQDVHAMLALASASQQIDVVADADEVAQSNSAPESSISRTQIAQTPGADRTNSLAYITDFVPGATIVHDQLHMRGGHQVTWAIDGVPVPNTNIASNVGPQFDPKDVEVVEAQRGSYSADYGDRTYGVLNVAPRSGFERNRLAELQVGYGTQHQTDDHISFGDHSSKFAYYISAAGNRSDYLLEPPTIEAFHDQAAGAGAFTSLTYNAGGGDQLRFAGSGRADFYQVPNDPAQQAAGVRNREREQDSFASLTWLHPLTRQSLLSVTPFFHFNRAAFEGSAAETPATSDNRASLYAGGQASVGFTTARHNARIGIYGFGQRDNTLFSLDANDGSGLRFSQRQLLAGALESAFIEDQWRLARWFTVTAGLRATRFDSSITETAASPRLGAALTLPGIHTVLRASYSRFYQAPPLSTIAGPLLQFALQQGVGFMPLRGERDEQYDFGVSVPLRRWNIDIDQFRTNARNYFDHDAVGESNIFLPLTIDRVLIRGTEVALRSPKLFGKLSAHLAYSRQSVLGTGGVTGGLTDFSPPTGQWFYLDHDQRDTLSTGVETALPFRAWTSFNLAYGSGFLNGDGPEHLPGYTTFDIAIGKSFGENWSAKLTATNLANERHFIDHSNTFGGSHINEPRMITVQLQYRFHY